MLWHGDRTAVAYDYRKIKICAEAWKWKIVWLLAACPPPVRVNLKN